MRTPLTLLFVFLLSITASAQQVQKCCNSTNSSFLLGSADYARHNQSLYIPSDFNNAIAGNITKLYYRYGTANEEDGNVLTDLTISLAQTTQTSFINDQFITDGLDAVLTAEVYMVDSGIPDQWFVIELDQTFSYDPLLSLVVDIRFDSSASLLTCRAVETPGRKVASGDPFSLVGDVDSDNLHDIGFDLDNANSIAGNSPMITMLYPNPATDHLQLRTDHGSKSSTIAEIFDVQGKLLRSHPINKAADLITIDISILDPGIYLLKLNRDLGKTHRFVLE
ncbi:MAG: T9SS type A sorting domain-containing protein [Bacteroidota bacterium]|nr:T9SS type A sorting domain-containing protein [Bacteroidota bacterium]